jgi:hypothetical protein
MSHLMLFHGNSGFAKAPQHYVYTCRASLVKPVIRHENVMWIGLVLTGTLSCIV